MLRFNLLPAQFRDQFVFAQRIARSARYLRIFIGLLGIFSLFLMFTLASLYHQQNLLLNQLASTKQSKANATISQVQKQIISFNQDVASALTLPRATDWSLLLIELSTITPTSIALDDLSLQILRAQTKALLRGKAQTRQDLIDYEKALRSSPYIASLLSPLANYETGKDLTFQITLTLNMRQFLKHENVK